MSEQEKAWKQQPLSDIFRIGREQILPSQQPKATFIHYSIPAWDEFGGPAFDLGETIESNKTAISEPSVLVSKLNPRKPRVVVIEAPERRTCCSTEFICYQPWRASESLRFWGMYLYSQEFSARLARVAIGSTNSHTRASPRETLDWLVPSVPIIEQGTIAQILDTLDTAIRETEALIDKLKAVKQGLLHDLLTRGIDADGQLRPPQSEAPQLYKESPLGWTPKEWGVQPLDAYTASEITYGIVQAGPHIPDGVPYIRTGDMSGDVLIRGSMLCTSRRIANSYARSEVRAGEIVMAIRATVGKVLSVPDDLDGANLTQGTARISPNTKTDGTFLLWAIRHSRAQKEIQLEVKGTTFAEITLGALRKVLIAAPIDISEQIEIAKRLAAIDERLWMEQEGLAKQLSEKSGLMDDLLIGRARVTPLLEST